MMKDRRHREVRGASGRDKHSGGNARTPRQRPKTSEKLGGKVSDRRARYSPPARLLLE